MTCARRLPLQRLARMFPTHINVPAIVVGGGLVITSMVLLSHFRKLPDSPPKPRVLCILVMILGFSIAFWGLRSILTSSGY